MALSMEGVNEMRMLKLAIVIMAIVGGYFLADYIRVMSMSGYFEEGFMEGCKEEGGTEAFCSCGYDQLVKKLGVYKFYKLAEKDSSSLIASDNFKLAVYNCTEK